MFYIACTRFNNTTYEENIDYRNKHNETVIYGSSFKIRDIYSPGSLIFVAEMNNQTNKIEGIGLIRNYLLADKRYKLYANNEYNRYVYRGSYWMSRAQIELMDAEIVEIFENILFKGKSHLKNRTGITILTDKLFTNWIYELYELKEKVKNVFITQFKCSIEHEDCFENREDDIPIPNPIN